MRAPGPSLAALVAALVLASSPLWAGRAADGFPPPPRPAPALFSAQVADVLLVRIYANAARDDEFVEIGNRRVEAIDVSGWSLSDGEATATFPLDSFLPPAGRLLITRNATSFAEDTLSAADFTFDVGASRRMENGVPRLADGGDEILLLDPNGAVVDAYAWGSSSYGGPGWQGRPALGMGRGEIATRVTDLLGAWIDRDVAEDWEGLRRVRLGQSSFDPPSSALRGRTIGVLSPDDGDDPLLRFLSAARSTIEVGVYTLTSERISSVLGSAAARGVRVRVLIDGAPVGGIEPIEHRLVGGLRLAGVDVRWLTSGPDIVKRYRYLHAKYAIVDARAAWVGSENFGDAGFPVERRGNRGWSVIVEDANLAATLGVIFESDFDVRRRDSIRADETDPLPLPSPPAVPTWTFGIESSQGVVQPVVAPETTLKPDGILGLFASATKRLAIDAFYLEERWRDTPNPFLEAAFAAAHRGVSVRILLDGSWASVGVESGTNDEVAARINARARDERVPLEARLLEPHGPIERLHNKGAVIDGRSVLVSSMNWALGSATENREIGLIVDKLDLAASFEAAFDADWEGRSTSGVDGWRVDNPVALLALYGFVGVASAISLRKLRAGAKDIKPRARLGTRGPSGARLRGRRGEVRVLPVELVAQPRARARGRARTRRGREEARSRLGGTERD